MPISMSAIAPLAPSGSGIGRAYEPPGNGPPMGMDVADAAEVAEGAGRVGLVARGVIYLVVALLALQVARNGSDAGDEQVDERGALSELADHAFGTALLVVLAVGFGCYALW